MRLKRKLGVIFVLIALLPYVVGMIIITLSSNTTIRANANGFFYEYTENIANSIANFFSTERNSGAVNSLSKLAERFKI